MKACIVAPRNIGRMLSDGENGRAAKAEQMAEDIANALVFRHGA